jgi:ATP-dependent DNA helicase RecG
MNLGFETEQREYKKSIAELKEAAVSISAILNKHGEGTIYFGVSNKGEVVGHQIGADTERDISRKIYERVKPIPNVRIKTVENGDGKTYIEVAVDGKEPPYAASGKYYIRVSDEDKEMTPAQLRDLFADTASYAEWEDAPTNDTADDIREDLLIACYNDGFKGGRFTEPYTDKESVLERLNLSKDGHLTNAGYYLLSKKKPVLLKLALYATDSKITFVDQNHFYGNIIECIQEALIFVKKHMRWRAEISGLKRTDIPEVPVDAVREIVVNSFAHAKYKGILSTHEIAISPSKIEIYNPGRLPSTVVPEDYLGGKKRSLIKNPTIAAFLFRSTMIEAFGTGFRRAILLCSEHDVKYAYNNDEQGFCFEFLRKKLYAESGDGKAARATLNATEKAIFEQLKQDGKTSSAGLAAKIQKTPRTVQRAIEGLKDKGYIKRSGGDFGGFWEII